MERIVAGRSATLTRTFTAAPTGTPTVAVVDSEGTAVTVGSVTGAGTDWTYTIPATSVPEVDTFTETWTATVGGTAQTFTDRIEVAGDVLFTIAELTAELTGTTGTYTDAQKADARTYAENELERHLNIALVPRFDVYRGNGDGYGFRVPRYGLRAVRWGRYYTSGVATSLSASDLLALELGEGHAYGYSWPTGYRNVEIGYEHGLDVGNRLAVTAKESALLLAKRHIVKGPLDDRATQRASDAGPINLATPGMFGSITGLPIVDEFIVSERIPALA